MTARVAVVVPVRDDPHRLALCLAALAAQTVPADVRDVVIRCSAVIIESLIDRPNDRLILAGASNLTRSGLHGRLPSTLPTVLDESAILHETILVSGGRRGLDLELAPDDLLAITNGRYAPIARAR